MRGVKSSVITMLTIGLLAGSWVALAAQDAEPAPPIEFTATWEFGPDLRTATSEVVDGVTMVSGGAWRPGVPDQASDPRLQGTLSIAANTNDYSATGSPAVWNYAFRIENDEGASQQIPTIDLEFPDSAQSSTTGVLVGEGGYAGLIAVFLNAGTGGTWALHGYIIDGELTPAPEPVISE